MRRPTNRICLRRRSSVLHAALPSRPIGELHLGLAGNRRFFFFFSLFFFFRGQIGVTQTHHGDSHINYVEELKLKLVKEPGEKAHFNIARPYKCRPTPIELIQLYLPLSQTVALHDRRIYSVIIIILFIEHTLSAYTNQTDNTAKTRDK